MNKSSNIWEQEKVIAAVENSESRKEILLKLGLNPNSNGNAHKLKQVADKFGIVLPYGKKRRVIVDGKICCPTCEIWKPLKDFHANSSRANGVSAYCKPCGKKHWSRWENTTVGARQRHQEWKEERKALHRIKMVEHFKNNPCVDCGNSDPRVLVFDHVRDEKFLGVAAMVNRGSKWDAIQQEIDKCEVRCHNCHVIVTNERANAWLAKLVV